MKNNTNQASLSNQVSSHQAASNKELGKQPFCNQQWKLGAFILFALLAITAFGGFYLFDLYEHDDHYEYGDNHHSENLSLNPSVATPAMQQRLSSAVVGIQSGGDYSSGVIIHPDGYIVSVLHSIKDSKDIQITVRNTANNTTKLYKGEVLKQLPEHDIVLIKLITKEQLPYLVLSDAPFTNTADIYALGSSEQGKFIMQAGNLSLIELSITINKKVLTHLLQSSAVYTWEQNGGPMVNHRGKLIGINLAIKDAQGKIHGLLIPVKILMAHLQDVVPAEKVKVSKKNTPIATNSTINSTLATTNNQAEPSNIAQPKTLAVAWWNKAQQQVNKARNKSQVQSFNGTEPMATTIAFVDPQHSPTRPLTFLDIGNMHPLKLGSYELNDILAMLVLGLIAGIMGIVTPLTGGLFMIVAMHGAMNYDFYLARPVIFMTFCFIYGIMTIRFRLDKSADRLFLEHPVILQLPSIIIGVIAGFLLANFIFDKLIIFLLAAIVVLVSINQLYGYYVEKLFISLLEKTSLKSRVHTINISDDHLETINPYELLTQDESSSKAIYNQWFNRIISSFPSAFSAGMFGVYNGALFLQSNINNLSIKKAQATSAQLIFFISLVATIVSLFHGMENELFKIETPFLLAIILIPPTFGGAFVAKRLIDFMGITTLRLITLTILILASALMVTL